MYYTEDIGHRWAIMAVEHKTLEQAERIAAHSSHDCMEVRVYDCTQGPRGLLVCTYRNGNRN